MMDLAMIRSAQELAANIPEGKPCVLIVGGREHNVIIERIGETYVIGRVALNKVVVLVNRPGRGGALAKVVNPQDEKSAVGPGDELIHSEPCVVGSHPRIRVKISSVDIFEEPFRPFLPYSALLTDGVVDPDVLCKAIPSFSRYRVEGKGFSESPAAWSNPHPKTPPAASQPRTLKLADDSSSGQ